VTIREAFAIGIAIILAIATTAGVLLNLMFLLGRRRTSSLDLQIQDQPANDEKIRDFLKAKAKEWKLPEADATRIRNTLEDLIDQIAGSNYSEGPVEIRVAYDDFDVTALLEYTGTLVQTASPKFSREPTEEQAFISGVSGYLSDVNADRVDPSVKDRECKIRLKFSIA
jgi:hypothetical protein